MPLIYTKRPIRYDISDPASYLEDLQRINDNFEILFQSAALNINDLSQQIIEEARKKENLDSDTVDGYHASIQNAPSTIVVRDQDNNIYCNNLYGNSSTADKLKNKVNIQLSGDVIGTTEFDGSSSVIISTSLSSQIYNSLNNLNTNGILIKNNSNLSTIKLETTGKGINITNNDGLTGNPLISINSTENNTPNTIVYRDTNGNFSANTITANLNGNATSASRLNESRTITLSGDVTGTTEFDGSANVTITTTVSDDSHNHSDSTITSINWSKILNKPTTLSGYGITDAYTKSEISTLLQGLKPKQSVRAATTGNITLSGLQTVDGVNLISGDRVLVKDQTNQTENGIYVVQSSAWQRSLDVNEWSEIVSAFVFVEEGIVNQDTAWVCTSNQGGIIGQTQINWVKFAGSGAYQPVDTTLTSLIETGNGILVKIGNNIVNRSITVNGMGLSVANSDGLNGNPVVTINSSFINTPNTIVYRDTNGNFSAGVITANLNGNASSASRLNESRIITLSGDVTGSTTFDGSANVTITTIVSDDSHNHSDSTITNIDWNKITNKPSTLSEYGITDAQPLDPDLTAIASLTSTTLGLLSRTNQGSFTTRSIIGSTGRIVVTNGNGISGNPTLDLATTGVVSGTYTKVDVDAYGRITSGTTLSASDIPNLDASKITSGQFPDARIQDVSWSKVLNRPVTYSTDSITINVGSTYQLSTSTITSDTSRSFYKCIMTILTLDEITGSPTYQTWIESSNLIDKYISDNGNTLNIQNLHTSSIKVRISLILL